VASGRRRGVESSATRAILIEAAAHLIQEEGYAAVTARRVASRAGLKPQLVHYYFKTMDDLLVAVIRMGGQMMLERVAEAVASEQPLRAVWSLGRDSRSATLSMEFLALANHRKAVRAEVKRFSEQIRIVLTAGLIRHFQERGYEPTIAPIVAIVLMSSASQNLMLEEALGISLGHKETQDFIESCLRRSEQIAPASPAAPPAAPQPRKRYTPVQRRRSRNTARK
jgi:AcrR family transcriptional regulator